MYLPYSSSGSFADFDIGQSDVAGAPVLCVWPLSGQYSVGSRYLYYSLVFASIFFLKTDWMRSAATAAALIYASVAAVHSIVLAAYSQKYAVDMDIWGAFQILAIGVLAAPLTVRYSRVYFDTDGRNLVFLWTLLVIAGLLSLVACFARATEQTCIDASGHNVTIDSFVANMSGPNNLQLCALECEAASSPIRRDPQNPSQYILTPHRGLTLDTATLLCAACCIPALLSLVTMWQKVVKANWQRLYSSEVEDLHSDVLTPAPDITVDERERRLSEKRVDLIIRLGLGLVERIFFCVCILAVVVLGEKNFWSSETRLGVEPMSSVGQWSPIVGAVLTAIGSAYTSWISPPLPEGAPANEGLSKTIESARTSSINLPPPPDPLAPPPRGRRRSSIQVEMEHHRQQFSRSLQRLARWTTPASDRFLDNIELVPGHAEYRDYPLIPGERERNPHLHEDEERHRAMQQATRSVHSLSSVSSGANTSSRERRQSVSHEPSRSNTPSGLLTPDPWRLHARPPMRASISVSTTEHPDDVEIAPPEIVITPDSDAPSDVGLSRP